MNILKKGILFTFKKGRLPNVSYYQKLFIFVLLPCILTIFAFISIFMYASNRYDDQITTAYAVNLQLAEKTIASNINEVIDIAAMLSINTDYADITTRPMFWRGGQYSRYRSISNSLRSMKSTKDLIHNVYLYSRYDPFVVTPDGICSTNLFFSYSYMYKEYEYINIETIKPIWNWYTALAPTFVDSSDSAIDSYVLPIVILPQQSNIQNWNITLVVNLDLDVLSSILDPYRLTPNSNLYVLDTEGNTLFSSPSQNKFIGISEEDKTNGEWLRMQEKQFSQNLSSFRAKNINNREMQYIIYTIHNEVLNDIILLAEVPVSEMSQNVLPIQINIFLICLLCLVLSVSFTYLLRRSMYKPVQGLLDMVDQSENKNHKNEFEIIRQHIGNIIQSNINYQKEISTMLPIVLEQHFINLLQNQGDMENTLAYLSDRGISFMLPDFQASIVRIQTVADEEQLSNAALIKSQCVNELLREINIFVTAYGILSNMDRIVIICNIGKDESIATLEGYYRDIIDRMEPRYLNLQLLVAMGQVGNGVTGMRRSFAQADNIASLLSNFAKTHIVQYSGKRIQPTIHYNLTDENKLINALLSGKNKETFQIIDEIMAKNSLTAPAGDMQVLMLALHLSVQRVIQERLLVIPEYSSDKSVYDMPYPQIKEYIYWLVDQVLSNVLNFQKQGPDFIEIMRYIEDNYNKDIYLDLLSERYNMTPQYLSKRFKNEFGISFHSYLANLRIAKAREILNNSKFSLDEIAKQVGFNNRFTFIRVFKAVEGITPTEYRESRRNY